jgi:methyl-accepting chemotaxis protein
MFGNIRIWQKFILIAVLIAIPLTIAVDSLSVGSREQSGLNRRKRDGVEYLRSIWPLLGHLASHRDAAAALMLGDPSQSEDLASIAASVDADLAAVESEDARQDVTFHVTERLDRFRTAWQVVKNEVTLNSDDQHDALIDEVLSLIDHVGNTSQLYQDNETVARHLVSLVTSDIPQITTALASLRSDAIRSAQIKPMTQAERMNLLKSLGRIEQARLRIEGSLAGAIDGNPSLESIVSPINLKGDELEKTYFYLIENNLLQSDPVTVTPHQISEALSRAIATQQDLLKVALNELTVIVQARIDGASQIRTNIAIIVTGGVLALLASFLVARSIIRPLRELVEASNRLVHGDLMSLLPSESDDEIGRLRTALSDLTAHQRDTALAAEARRDKLQTEVAGYLEESSRAMGELANSLLQLSENAAVSANVAEQSRVNAAQGSRAVQESLNGMMQIREQVQEMAKCIKRLGERSQESGEIIQMLEDIADRTRMLALNASIHAGAGGEGGRGFGVVAEEVQRLADRSTTATRKIAALVKSIQSETIDATACMEETTREVVSGSRLASAAGEALLETLAVSNKLAELTQTLAHTAERHVQNSESAMRFRQTVNVGDLR